MPPDDWLTIKQAAERLHKPVRTVRDAAGRLPAEFRRKVEPLPLQVQYAALEAYLRGELVAADTCQTPLQGAQETRTDTERESAGNTALLAQMQAEIEYLRGELTATRIAAQEATTNFQILMAQKDGDMRELQKQLAIPEGKAGESGARQKEAATEEAPTVPLWKRLFFRKKV